MLCLEDWMDVQLLAKQGYSQREIARLSGHSRNTVRKLLAGEGAAVQERHYAQRRSKLDPFKEYVHDRYTRTGLNAVRLYGEVRGQGYSGGIDVVRRYVRTLAPERTALRKATVRYETAPGEQGQVDWAYCGRLRDEYGQERPVYAFLLVLGFSRLLHVTLSTDMRLETLIRCHEAAFGALDGCPSTILYDNMKQVRLSPTTFNPLFVDFAAHWGFVPTTHRVRRPRPKGKVERMVDYLKENFFRGRTFADLADARAQVQHWLDHTANVRVHATTQQRPLDLWEVERPLLRATLAPYRLASRAVRKVSAEGWVHYQGARYSVPPTHVGQTVLVEVHDEQRRVVIRADQVIVAEHPHATKRGATLSDPAHVAAVWELTLAQGTRPPIPWQRALAEPIAPRPLSAYEALVS